ncbi:MAG: TetR/AcrR family transcriptional regulator [Promethearchaeota archaeon]|nr:MAG: TetR/AcrR family transcriptional regulator [Candidatus Lokiarchaeota archaeon]
MSDSQKKEEIANAFMEYFLKYGMKKTIIDDVVRSLGMSKKTIYKYFKGGKEEALYFFYRKIADAHVLQLESEIKSIPSVQDKLKVVLQQIYGISRPHVEANVADEDDYAIEAEIVGSAFKEAYQEILKNTIIEGIQSRVFQSVDVELTIHLIRGIILESLRLVHQNHSRQVEDASIDAIMKILQ